MNTKSLVWGGMIIGSFAGGYLPYFWDGGVMSYLIWSAIGGIAGIYIGFKLGKSIE